MIAKEDFLGAGIASVKRIEELRDKGIDAKLLVLNKTINKPYIIGVFNNNTFWGKVCMHVIQKIMTWYKKNKLVVKDNKFCMYDMQNNLISAKYILKLYGEIPDIIDVSWVTDFINVKTIYKLKKITGAKIIYTMMDNAHITGGCHFPWRCIKYQDNCYPCPALSPNDHRAEKTLVFKKKYITKDMAIIGSAQDYLRARQSVLFRNNKVFHKQDLPTNPYYYEKEVGRKLWNIDEDRFVIFIGASNLSDERKGFKHVIEALEYVKESGEDINKITILIAGICNDVTFEGFDIRLVGTLSFEDLFKAYCCSSIYICSSLEDSGPMMMIYGIMSYIPVICYPIGYSFDFVKHKINGYVAEWGNTRDLGEGILYWYRKSQNDNIDLHEINDKIAKESNAYIAYNQYLGIS